MQHNYNGQEMSKQWAENWRCKISDLQRTEMQDIDVFTQHLSNYPAFYIYFPTCSYNTLYNEV